MGLRMGKKNETHWNSHAIFPVQNPTNQELQDMFYYMQGVQRSGKNQGNSRLGKSQGILLKVREKMNIGKSQRKVREFAFSAI